MNSRSVFAVSYLIHQLSLKFTLLLIITLISACDSNSAGHLKKLTYGQIKISPTESLKTYLAITPEQQIQGLSGIKSQDFSDSEAMLFTANSDKRRQFWMPNTYFDLDIFFLSKDLYILEVHRSLEHFEQKGPDQLIPRSKMVKCRHVLEIKSSSPLAKKIHPGMTLKWKGPSLP